MALKLARLAILGFALAVIVSSCGPWADSNATTASREHYAEQLGAFLERNNRLCSEDEGVLKTVLEDPKLGQDEKSRRVIEQFDHSISSIKADVAELKRVEPPSDLLPVHEFFLSDLSESQSISTDLRDSFKAQDQNKINAVLERFNAYDHERKQKLKDALRNSWLEPDVSVASFKDAIAKPRPGAGVRWAGLPINTWLVFGWFALACICTHNKRIWQAAKWGGLPPGDEEPPGCLVLLILPQYALLAILFYFNWQQALSVFVITFFIASFLSFIMELIGMILMIPFVLVYKSVHRRSGF
jgi:hypothetical protein